MDAPVNIKMIVIDIDGTLLSPEGSITTRSLEAVLAAQQAGIAIALATARRYSNTAPIANELGLNTPLILYDGAIIIQHPQKAILHKHLLGCECGTTGSRCADSP